MEQKFRRKQKFTNISWAIKLYCKKGKKKRKKKKIKETKEKSHELISSLDKIYTKDDLEERIWLERIKNNDLYIIELRLSEGEEKMIFHINSIEICNIHFRFSQF